MEQSVAVVYRSKGGATQKYAQWLADELGADLYEGSRVKAGDLARYHTLLYGGGLYVGGVNGLKAFLRKAGSLEGKRFAVFAVGLTPSRPEIYEEVKVRAFPNGLKEGHAFFLLRGDFDYGKLGFVDRLLMDMLKASIKRKKELTADERGMLAAYERPVAFSSQKQIAPIVEWAQMQQAKS